MRLIDVDAMHTFVEEKVAEGKNGWANGVPYEWAYALTAVDMQPTIDAVGVVRCKDCVKRDQAFRCIALYYGFNPHDDWFCAEGERDNAEVQDGTE